jgi:hypothetical protein
MHEQFHKWAAEFGPIYSIMLGSQTMIILSSDEVVKELLDKRGSIYSDRPQNFIAKMCSRDQHMLTMLSQ